MSSTAHSQPFNPVAHRIAFIHAFWHEDIVLNCLKGFQSGLSDKGYDINNIEVISVAGAYEIPLQAKLLAKSEKFSAIACSGLVVDGGIYRHEFVAQAVASGLMQVQLECEIPVLTAVLTPHQFHEHDEHRQFFAQHFISKGNELANACDSAIRQTILSKAY